MSVVGISFMNTCLGVPKEAPCKDLKCFYYGMTSHLSILKLTTRIKYVPDVGICSKKVKGESTSAITNLRSSLSQPSIP